MNQSEYDTFRDRLFSRIWRELDPLETQIEDEERLPLETLIPTLREMGAFGLLVPEEYGGLGLTIEQYLPVIAEFAKVQGGIRVLVHVHNSFAHALSEIGSPEQRAAILPGAADGRHSIAFALTEPEHGTGADLGSTAHRDGDEYVLTGRKWLITNSDIASHFIVFARTSATEVSAFVVERDRPGFTITPLPETMGCKGGEHGELVFDGVRIPAANRIGAEGQGQEHLERALEISRVFIAASSLGTAQRALDLSLAHARQRVTFGKPIAHRQAVQRYLAEMATDVYALRHMLLDAARKWDAGQRIPLEASLCKLFGLEAVGRVTDRALLVHGGIGYTRRTPIERLYRDARLNWLEEGPPTIQYLVAARELVAGHDWADAFAGTGHA
ncbi:acyl-CoA dehydrogenase family protein [Micromonospora sp. CB01531]|uniref:acyl-CoA dehydrogenase family protein n=1 Tax=Micromonospora sp. CB01531 TaxID=1718947 RepID=UPI0009397294|nr:acyl-CoA dehydrogenase family protein [Micromonospora sp. CB01531]OKI63378.1 acyl-CoA dehydrogenase [Micromonospora sp. CB01531]